MKVSLTYKKKMTPAGIEDDNCLMSSNSDFDSERNKKIFDHLKQFLSVLEQCDPNAERSLQV